MGTSDFSTILARPEIALMMFAIVVFVVTRKSLFRHSTATSRVTANVQKQKYPGLSVETATIAVVMSLFGVLYCLSTSPKPPRGDRRVAAVQREIEQLRTGINHFTIQFGIQPPSLVVVYEKAGQWDQDPWSRHVIRHLWPRFDFTMDRDINRDGDVDDQIELTGSECLVFFLGGIRDEDTSADPPHRRQFPFIGFSRNPMIPFQADQGSRNGPFFEFKRNRLADVDGDGFHEYLPPILNPKAPYLYLNNYRGQGYRAADCHTYNDAVGQNLQQAYFRNEAYAYQFDLDAFQIICAGRDNLYGTGGMWAPELSDELLSGQRAPERDNLTSFHSGALGEIPEPN